MKKIALILITCLAGLNAIAQSEASNWYFGENAGIKFNKNGSITHLTTGALNTIEGCTTISDNNGDLLFYTDGITVWNKNHYPMPNASQLAGTGLFGDSSSSQSAIVVPNPDDPNIYYIFTVDRAPRDNNTGRGFNYSIVDLTLQGGLGDVTKKNINLLPASSEKISAVLKDCISKSIWVITFAPKIGSTGNNDTFYAYEVSNTGVNTTPVESTFDVFVDDVRGYLKLSPDGTKLACANSRDGLFLYDFDTTTGIVSNQTPLNINFFRSGKPQFPYGIEFSQNNELLYVTTFYQGDNDDFDNPNVQYGTLLQYNLEASDINASETVIDQRQTYRGALQLAPNGKIYRAMSDTYDIGSPFLSTINNPNLLGTACNYQHNAIQLSRNSRQGLPPFITSFFSEKIDIVRNGFESIYLPLCIGETYTLQADDITGATYNWTKDNVPLPESNFDLTVSQPGFYNVKIETSANDCDNLEGEAIVEYFDIPITNTISDVLICDDDNDGKSRFNFIEQSIEALGNQDPDIYTIKYFLSQIDADLNQNEISLPFENNQNQQIIYTRLGIKGNDNCFDSSVSFLIQVNNTPKANSVNLSEICDSETPSDLDTTNGQTEINLHQFDNQIIGTQDASLYYITYYNSEVNAETKSNPLNFSYYNQTPFKESIYARIENNSNTNCFAISPAIELTINPLPTYTNTTLIQCDEDGTNDNITTYNLLEAQKELTNNLPNRTLKFFNSLNDAENNLNEILNTNNFQNTTSPQTIYVQIIDENTYCFSIAQLELETSSTQINDYTAPPVCDELNSEDGFNVFNLNDITTEIQSINNITFPVSYYETYEDALIEENELTSPYTNTVAYSQILFARAENNNACYGINQVTLTINKLPEIITDDLFYYCLNTFPETITINAGIINDSPNNYTYNWSNGENTYEIQINEPNTYSVTVTNSHGCSKNRTVIIEPSNIATFNTTEPFKVIDVSANNTVTVFVSGEGIYQYQLVNNDNVILKPFQDSNIFENVPYGIHTVEVKDLKNNCGVVSDEVSVIGFPKFFTPNNDGFNDTWQVYGISNIFQPNTKILIYNRYGKLLKEILPNGQGWDGTINGKKLPSDDYWFSVKLEDGRIFKNHFTLKY